MDFHATAQQCAPVVEPRAMLANARPGPGLHACGPGKASLERRPASLARQQAHFVRTYGSAAERAGAALGVDPNVLLGQWGLETGWGRSIIPGTNNLGNIKDFSGAGVAATDNQTGSVDRYRQFGSLDAFADQYVGLIRRRYPDAIGAGAYAGRFAMALKAGGYAEDPAYAAKVQASYRMVAGKAAPVQRPARATAAPADSWDVYGAREI